MRRSDDLVGRSARRRGRLEGVEAIDRIARRSMNRAAVLGLAILAVLGGLGLGMLAATAAGPSASPPSGSGHVAALGSTPPSAEPAASPSPAPTDSPSIAPSGSPPPSFSPPPSVPPTPTPTPTGDRVPDAGASVITSVYESGYSIGDPIYAAVGGAWASHPGGCAIIKTVNGGAPLTVAMSGCGAQTVQVGTMLRMSKEYAVTVRATSEDGTRTSDSATETYYAEGVGPCNSAPAALRQDPNLPEGAFALQVVSAPALPPCDCGGSTGRICPVTPVANPTDGGSDQRYAWASVLFGGAALLRTLRLRGRGRKGDDDSLTPAAAYRSAPAKHDHPGGSRP